MMRRYIVSALHGVNHKFPAPAGRPDPASAPPSSRRGRALGGGTAGRSRNGAIEDFESSRAVEAGRSGGRPASGQECLLWPNERPEARPATGESERIDAG